MMNETTNTRDLLRFAKAFSNLGASLQNQLEDLLFGYSENVTNNALLTFSDKLREIHEEIDIAIDEEIERRETLGLL